MHHKKEHHEKKHHEKEHHKKEHHKMHKSGGKTAVKAKIASK